MEEHLRKSEQELLLRRSRRLQRAIGMVSQIVEQQDALARRCALADESQRAKAASASARQRQLAIGRALQKERLRRMQLKRWESDPRRTLEEIMRGPPVHLRRRSRSRGAGSAVD